MKALAPKLNMESAIHNGLFQYSYVSQRNFRNHNLTAKMSIFHVIHKS